MFTKVTTLLLFASICSAAVFKTSLTRESYSKKLILEKKWDEYRILRNIKKGMFRSTAQRLGVARQPFYDYADVSYTSNITIGTPKIQEFRVILDTGSSNLWVVDKSCNNGLKCQNYCEFKTVCQSICNPDCCKNQVCYGKKQFDQNKSTTYQKDGRDFSMQYGTDSLSGFLGIDTVSLGDKGTSQLDIVNTTFGQVSHVASYFADIPVDGILGLGFKSIAVDNVQPVFQHAVELGLLDKPIFTVWLKKDGGQSKGQNGGQITYGDLDTEHCDKDITYVELSSEKWWEFNIEGTGVNGNKDLKSYSAISDTGTSLIVGPKSPLNELVNATNATYNSQYGLYSVDCNVKFTWSIWISGKEFPIDSTNMIWEVEPSKCVLAYEMWNPGPSSPNFILGDPFIREYCQIYQIEGSIGLTHSLK